MLTLRPPNKKLPISILLLFSQNCQIKLPPIFPAMWYIDLSRVKFCGFAHNLLVNESLNNQADWPISAAK